MHSLYIHVQHLQKKSDIFFVISKWSEQQIYDLYYLMTWLNPCNHGHQNTLDLS